MIDCYAKYIVCEVEPEHRAGFSETQLAWAKTAQAAGFRGQLGGWAADGVQAVIVALWRDRAAYEGFWKTLHHEILTGSNQSLHYRCVNSSFVSARLSPAGTDELDGLLARVTAFAVRTSRQEPFAPPVGGFTLTALAAQTPLAIAFGPREPAGEADLRVALEPSWTVMAHAASRP